MNLLDRILAADWTTPQARALLVSVGINVVVWLRWGWRLVRRLRAAPDPLEHDDYEAWRKSRDLAAAKGDVFEELEAMYGGRSILADPRTRKLGGRTEQEIQAQAGPTGSLLADDAPCTEEADRRLREAFDRLRRFRGATSRPHRDPREQPEP